MTLDLAEQGLKGDAPEVSYAEETMCFIQQQYERIQADPQLIAQWLENETFSVSTLTCIAQIGDQAGSFLPIIHIAVDKLASYGMTAA